MVRVTGLEPVRCHHRGILSPLRLPIPPHPHVAGLDGFEPSGCRSQSPVPYRLATVQYINEMGAGSGVEPLTFSL